MAGPGNIEAEIEGMVMNKSILSAVVIVVVLALWMLSGLLPGRSDADDSTANNASAQNGESAGQSDSANDADKRLMKVEVMRIAASEVTRELTLQGQLEPLRRLHIVGQIGGLVESISATRGQRVKQGDLLLKLDLETKKADLAEANAMVKAAADEQRAASNLQKRGLQSGLALSQANAKLASAVAARDRIALKIRQTEILAPFDGVLNDLMVEEGELIERGMRVADIVDDSGFKVAATAAQQVVQQISQGQTVIARLITGEELAGKITYLSSVADPTTRSFTVEAEVANTGQALAAGVSATLVVPVESVAAAMVSPSALALGPDGEIGVKTIDQDNTVEFHPVSIISTTSDGAWVTGIPDNSTVIMLGQGFVNPGDEVDPVETSPL